MGDIKAVFVGVNKHVDPSIPELSGARADAHALWSIFNDSFQGLASRLLVDENATCDSVRDALFGTLASAGPDDIVILSFAGHGTPDGRLVLYDTQTTDLPSSAIAMADVAEAFKETKARVVLCILDCCFSGQAPARVLEVDATPRSAFLLADVAGEGRILLSACAGDEAAWEQPGTAHGLLTYAVLEALTDAKLDQVRFPEIGGEIIRIARVEADRLAVRQTPVFLGTVKGGLTFPVLRKGENFTAAFGTRPARTLSGPFQELVDVGVSSDIVAQLVERYPDGMNALQLKAVNSHGVIDGKSLLLIAPTSSGKTMVGELAAARSITAGRKVAFLVPYRAIVNEKFDEFLERYGPAGLRIVRCSGDATDGVGPVMNGRYDLAFFTYETFLSLALGSPRLLSQLGLIVIDEAQFITDPNRGMTVELICALLLRARRHGISPQLVMLSAVIGELNGFDRWLGLDLLISKDRPVPLVEGVLDRNGTFQYLDADGTTKTETLLDRYEIRQRRDKPSSQDVIVPLARKLIAKGEKIIVFRNIRGKAKGCATYLAKELGLPPAADVLSALPTTDLTGSSAELRACLQGGTAFHNTNLLRPERVAVEQGFRARNGGIHVLGATTTLAAGINTPASTVILAENEFVGEDGRPFNIAEYKNMAGRAGRVGFNETGRAVILADTPIERAQLFNRYVMGAPESVQSSFKDGQLPTWVLRLLRQVRNITRAELPSLLANTFAGFLAARSNPAWIANVERQLAALVERMMKARLADESEGRINLTLLGQACGSSSLSFESALRLVELMRGFDATPESAPSLVALIQVLDELDEVYTPILKKGSKEGVHVTGASRRYGAHVVHAMQRYGVDTFGFWARCKRACIVWDWLEGDAVENMERVYSATPFQGAIGYGDIAKFAENTRFHLRSAQQIFAAMFPERQDFAEALDTILLRLEFGLPAGALSLAKLRTPLTRGAYLELYRNGCRTPDDVLSLDPVRLGELVGLTSMKAIRAGAVAQ